MTSPELPSSDFAQSPEQAGKGSDQGARLQDNAELTWEERLSSNAFWVFDYLQVAGNSEYLRELAKAEDIDFNAGLDELREQGLLDESDPNCVKIRWR